MPRPNVPGWRAAFAGWASVPPDLGPPGVMPTVLKVWPTAERWGGAVGVYVPTRWMLATDHVTGLLQGRWGVDAGPRVSGEASRSFRSHLALDVAMVRTVNALGLQPAALVLLAGHPDAFWAACDARGTGRPR